MIFKIRYITIASSLSCVIFIVSQFYGKNNILQLSALFMKILAFGLLSFAIILLVY